jgi:hypothetical protein
VKAPSVPSPKSMDVRSEPAGEAVASTDSTRTARSIWTTPRPSNARHDGSLSPQTAPVERAQEPERQNWRQSGSDCLGALVARGRQSAGLADDVARRWRRGRRDHSPV